MIPTEDKSVVKNSSRNIAPHAAHLIITNLKEISGDWWAEIKTLLSSKSISDRKFALTEINKIQLKAMPNQLSADEGVNISVNIVNYGDTIDNPSQFQSETVPGTVIKSDG